MELIGDLIAQYALISSPLRRISFLVPHVVIEELHSDDLAVTDHPVETGAAISDHAFKLPARVEMRCGWSNSLAETEGFVQQITQALLSIQARRQPFTVFTGKRVYRNMLLGRIGIETTAETEDTVLAVLGLREVIITSTQTTGNSAPKEAQAMPDKTGGVSEKGQAVPSFAGTSISPDGTVYNSPGNGSFSPGSNTDFSGTAGSQSLGPSGASAGFDTITFDGEPTTFDIPDASSGFSPGDFPGSAGQFGRYGPGAFSGTPTFSSGFNRI